MNKRKKNGKIETSKKILIVSYAIAIVLTALTVVCVILRYDAMTMGTVTGLAYAEVAVSNAFYFNKAKKENTLKIALSCAKMDSEKIDKVAKMTETINKID